MFSGVGSEKKQKRGRTVWMHWGLNTNTCLSEQEYEIGRVCFEEDVSRLKVVEGC